MGRRHDRKLRAQRPRLAEKKIKSTVHHLTVPKFMLKLTEQLLEHAKTEYGFVSKRKAAGRPPKAAVPAAVAAHCPESVAAGAAKYCSQCKKASSTNYCCPACEVNLCIPSTRQRTADGMQRNCFRDYHAARAREGAAAAAESSEEEEEEEEEEDSDLSA